MSILRVLCITLALTLSSHASTVLFVQHQGSNNPLTEGWSGPSSSNVSTSAYNDNGLQVWRVSDPFTATTSTSNNYSKVFDDTLLTPALQNGWEFNARLKVPESDPTTGRSWAPDSNIWVGLYYKHATNISGLSSTLQRAAFAFMFGLTAEGKTEVTLWNAGISSKILEAGYHDYRMVYSPITKQASVYVDGIFWTTFAGNISTLTSASINQMYWGDNNGQNATGSTPRTAYYEHVSFTIAPEPSLALLAGVGAASLLLRRTRSVKLT